MSGWTDCVNTLVLGLEPAAQGAPFLAASIVNAVESLGACKVGNEIERIARMEGSTLLNRPLIGWGASFHTL